MRLSVYNRKSPVSRHKFIHWTVTQIVSMCVWEGCIREENNHSFQIKIRIKKLCGKIVSVSARVSTERVGVLWCGNELAWEYGTGFCRAARRGCGGKEGAYSSLSQQGHCCTQRSKRPQAWYRVCKASGLRLVTLGLNQLVVTVSSLFFSLDLL